MTDFLEIAKHGFNVTPLCVVGLFALPIYLGIRSVRDMQSPRANFIVVGLAILLGGIAWLVSAKQDMGAVEQAIENGELKTLLNHIAEAVAPAAQPDFVESLRRATPAELRAKTEAFTEELRHFNNEMSEVRQKALEQRFDYMNSANHLTTDQMSDRFWQSAKTDSARAQQWTAQFQASFQPRGMALRDELAKRLGSGLTFKTDWRWIPLDFGSLSGPDPLMQLANVFDEAARRLR